MVPASPLIRRKPDGYS